MPLILRIKSLPPVFLTSYLIDLRLIPASGTWFGLSPILFIELSQSDYSTLTPNGLKPKSRSIKLKIAHLIARLTMIMQSGTLCAALGLGICSCTIDCSQVWICALPKSIFGSTRARELHYRIFVRLIISRVANDQTWPTRPGDRTAETYAKRLEGLRFGESNMGATSLE